MPERSIRQQQGCRQASPGAQRRCRGPGGASRSLRARGEPADAATRRSPTRAGLISLNPADAAHGVPPKRNGRKKVRKFDSLSAATKGPTAMMLRLVLRCVNGGAGRNLECGVQAVRAIAAHICGAFSRPVTMPRRSGRNRLVGAGQLDERARESIACTG
jgi:hypothetical protein